MSKMTSVLSEVLLRRRVKDAIKLETQTHVPNSAILHPTALHPRILDPRSDASITVGIQQAKDPRSRWPIAWARSVQIHPTLTFQSPLAELPSMKP